MRKHLKKDGIPVFYVVDEGKYCLGLSRMIRLPYRRKVSDGIEQVQIPNVGYDLCKTMFGSVKGKEQLKGRVLVGHAFAKEQQSIKPLKSVTGVLGAPKASYYPLYLKQQAKPYKDYDSEEITIAGRKRYRVHAIKENGMSINPIPYEYDTDKQKKDALVDPFSPLPPECIFTFKISVHNLLPVETGALLSALTFHQTKGVWHNIGLAKAYGYGKISCTPSLSAGFKYSIDDYIHAFENEMNSFTRKENTYQQSWIETEQIQKLLSIAQEHNEGDVKVMSLSEYRHYKDSKNFSRLEEKSVNREYNECLYQAEQALEDQNFSMAQEYVQRAMSFCPDKICGRLQEIKSICDEHALDELNCEYNELCCNAERAFDEHNMAMAQEYARQAIELLPNRINIRLEEILSLCEDYRRNELLQKYNELCDKAEQALAEKKYDSAKSLLNEAMEIYVGTRHTAIWTQIESATRAAKPLADFIAKVGTLKAVVDNARKWADKNDMEFLSESDIKAVAAKIQSLYSEMNSGRKKDFFKQQAFNISLLKKIMPEDDAENIINSLIE